MPKFEMLFRALVPLHAENDKRLRPQRSRGDGVGTTSDNALAALAVPDADSLAADGDLAAEGAGVLGVLSDFHLLHLLTQGGTVTGTIFTGNTDLLCALGHLD